MDQRTLRQLPQYLLLITANALPVYGACTGQIVFFQVLWLYWMECLILIGFDLVRIAFARGSGPGADAAVILTLRMAMGPAPWTPWMRAAAMLRTAVCRMLILGFYLVFLILFVGFQVTDRSHMMDVVRSLAFMDSFVNTALAVFLINGIVQLIGEFFLNGLYKQAAPVQYTGVFDRRSVIMHVMIGTSLFIHGYLFRGKPYAWIGESVYVGIFMLVHTVLDIRQLRRPVSGQAEPMAMI